MEPIVISISPDGKVSGMHRDEFNLGFLGKQHIERASEILFNDDTQKWEIAVPTERGTYVVIEECGTFDSYNAARTFEVQWMNECFLNQCRPFSKQGSGIAARMRCASSATS